MFHQSGNCAKRFIYVFCRRELVSDVGRQDDNVSTGCIAFRVLPAHAFAEIVFGAHLVGTARFSSSVLLHNIAFAHYQSRVGH